MSYCKIVVFKDSLAEVGAVFGNSWGGAARIWDAMFEKYLKGEGVSEWASWLTLGDKDGLWDLAKSKAVPKYERIVHASTFDYAVIFRDNFENYVECLRLFVKNNPVSSVDHLSSWADFIEGVSDDVKAIGFHQTSTTENPWVVWEWIDEEQVSRPYSLKTDDDHFNVYEFVKRYT